MSNHPGIRKVVVDTCAFSTPGNRPVDRFTRFAKRCANAGIQVYVPSVCSDELASQDLKEISSATSCDGHRWFVTNATGWDEASSEAASALARCGAEILHLSDFTETREALSLERVLRRVHQRIRPFGKNDRGFKDFIIIMTVASQGWHEPILFISANYRDFSDLELKTKPPPDQYRLSSDLNEDIRAFAGEPDHWLATKDLNTAESLLFGSEPLRLGLFAPTMHGDLNDASGKASQAIAYVLQKWWPPADAGAFGLPALPPNTRICARTFRIVDLAPTSLMVADEACYEASCRFTVSDLEIDLSPWDETLRDAVAATTAVNAVREQDDVLIASVPGPLLASASLTWRIGREAYRSCTIWVDGQRGPTCGL